MKKLTLDTDEVRVDSFETVREDETAAAVITGKICLTRQTVYETCCSV